MSHHTGHSINRIAFSATVHCLTGCAIGEVLGMVIGTGFNLSNLVTIILSTALAFLIGYSLTLKPLLSAGIVFGTAVGLAFASDTLSIATMELADNATMLLIPNAMNATLTQPLFWGSLVLSLVTAGVLAFPVNRWLMTRGKGHGVIHEYMGHNTGHGNH